MNTNLKKDMDVDVDVDVEMDVNVDINVDMHEGGSRYGMDTRRDVDENGHGRGLWTGILT